MTYIGIDPGKKGGLAIIDNGIAQVLPFDERDYLDALRSIDPQNAIVCLEFQSPRPGQSAQATFHHGENYGWLQGVLAALGISYQLVAPRKWKGEFGLDAEKQKSIAACKRLFPAVRLRENDRCRTDHDGMAEALLMAEYAKRKLVRADA